MIVLAVEEESPRRIKGCVAVAERGEMKVRLPISFAGGEANSGGSGLDEYKDTDWVRLGNTK